MLRQLIDAGTLSNLPGGLKSRGLRVKGDDTPISPGEFRDVDVPSGTIKDNIMLLPYKEPSQTLSQLFNQIVTEGRNFVSAGDLQVSDMGGNAPVGTTLAILERTLKVMSAIQARLHYSMKQEFKLLKHIIADYTPESYDYEPEEGKASAKKADYDDVEVIPVSDPNASTMAQKIVQWQAVMQLAQQAPQLYNLPFLHRQMVETLGIKNASKLIPMADDQKPADPVTENQNILIMKPVKAFQYQDHESHIAVHQAAMQDPKIMALLQNNPQAQQLQAAMMSHINEHAGFLYRSEIEKQMGMALPPQHMNDMNEEEDVGMTPEVEYALSQKLAQAANQLLQQNKQQAAQQQAQQQAQDPIIQMQQQELQLKAQEQKRKEQKDQTDAQLKMKQLDIEAQRIQSQQRVAGMNTLAQTAVAKDKLKHQQRIDGGKLVLEAMSKDQQRLHEVGTKAIEGKNKRDLAAQQHLHNKDATEQQHRQSMEQQQLAARQAKKEVE
jgi:hypothetical protein